MNEDSQTIPEKSPCDASGTMNPAEARAWAEGWNEARAVVSARLAAVEALHYPEAKHGTWCEQDKEHWPCATILALNASSSEAPA